MAFHVVDVEIVRGGKIMTICVFGDGIPTPFVGNVGIAEQTVDNGEQTISTWVSHRDTIRKKFENTEKDGKRERE